MAINDEYCTLLTLDGLGGRNIHLWRSQAALRPVMPEPITAIRLPSAIVLLSLNDWSRMQQC
jgi:hypothetical protein